MQKWCQNNGNGGEVGLYSISYFQILFDKNGVPQLSLFDVKSKGVKNEVHTLFHLKNWSTTTFTFYVQSEKRSKKRSTHSIFVYSPILF